MMSVRQFVAVAVILALPLARETGAAPPRDVFGLSMEAFGNSVDGTRGPRCEVSSVAPTGGKTEWWISIGEARPGPRGGWEAVGNAIRCGTGSPDPPGKPSGGQTGVPYLVATISTVAGVSAERLGADKVIELAISLTFRRLSDFGAAAVPRYNQSTEQRSFFFPERGTAFLPLLVADERESGAFKFHEALIGIHAATGENRGVAAYGAVSVTSDLDGAELLLDGGSVGKISLGKETILANVLAGEREVAVRDSSGRALHRIVRVEPGRTAMISLALPDPARNAAPYARVFVGKNAQGYEEYRRERDGAVIVKVPAGEFLMGNRDTEGQPLEHVVEVPEFLMDKTPVSWSQFKRYAGASGASLPPHPPYWGIHDDHGAVFITWEEAKAYCEWAGGRLPTEAEREKAARGTDRRKFPWGNEEPDPQRAVFRRNWGYVATDPVGSHPGGASPYGLLDMGGNTWEWVADWWDANYFEVSPRRDPKGPRSGRGHVVKGGSWDSRPTVLSASSRNFGYRGYREGDYGFRCAMDPAG
jgi:formylglycine-generating enzyme required for sulfatase activity